MTEPTSAVEGRVRHSLMGQGLIDLGLGVAACLAAITMAHAGLPEPVHHAPRPTVEWVTLTSAPIQPEPPPPLIAFVDPVPGRVIVSPFGLRRLPWEEGGRLHAGIDVQAARGEAVAAAADGVVTEAGTRFGYGRYVVVKHAEGLTTLYGHLGRISAGIAPGRALRAGEALGEVGSSGTSTGPHLHFEIRDRKDRPMNPALFLGRAFAEVEDLPLRKAQGYDRRVRLAQVSAIPASKRALMKAKAEQRLADAAAKDLPSVISAGDAGVPASAVEADSQGVHDLTTGADGRPRAKLTL